MEPTSMDVPIIHVCFEHWLWNIMDVQDKAPALYIYIGSPSVTAWRPCWSGLGFIIRTTSNQLTQNSPKTTWQRIKGNNLNVNAMNQCWFMMIYVFLHQREIICPIKWPLKRTAVNFSGARWHELEESHIPSPRWGTTFIYQRRSAKFMKFWWRVM
jgi:hypothetical protein